MSWERMNAVLDSAFDRLIMPFLAFVVVVCLALAGVMIWAGIMDYRSPVFELKKADWTCTRSHVQVVTVGQFVGKVYVTHEEKQTVCDVWERKQ